MIFDQQVALPDSKLRTALGHSYGTLAQGVNYALSINIRSSPNGDSHLTD